MIELRGTTSKPSARSPLLARGFSVCKKSVRLVSSLLICVLLCPLAMGLSSQASVQAGGAPLVWTQNNWRGGEGRSQWFTGSNRYWRMDEKAKNNLTYDGARLSLKKGIQSNTWRQAGDLGAPAGRDVIDLDGTTYLMGAYASHIPQMADATPRVFQSAIFPFTKR